MKLLLANKVIQNYSRKTAYKSRLPASARFKESAPPTIGMRTMCWQSDRCSSISPERSLPARPCRLADQQQKRGSRQNGSSPATNSRSGSNRTAFLFKPR
jgi:hypothetical protein